MLDDGNIVEQTLLVSSQHEQQLAYGTFKLPKQLYEDLDVASEPGSIRLLDIQATPAGRDDAPLIGNLRVVRLQDRPAFTTLSYVWGPKVSPTPKVTCLPHRVDLDISANCFQSLRHIRKRVGTVTIWVDAICINQEDAKEKETQIPLMQEIYSSATIGYIWLGEGSKGLDFAVRCLKLRARIFRRLPLAYIIASPEQRKRELRNLKWRLWGDAFSRLRSQLSWGFKTEVIALHTDGEELVWVLQLLSHPWAFRAWTFQELALSENPIFLCGDKLVLWEDIINAVRVQELNPAMAVVLDPWRSLAETWLSFPRQPRHTQQPPDSDNEALQPWLSFRELIDDFWTKTLFHAPGMAFVSRICIFLTILGPMCLPAGLIYCILRMLAITDTNLHIALFVLIILGTVFFLTSMGKAYLNFFDLFWNFVFFGSELNWLPTGTKSADDNGLENIFLSGVWTALRERAASEPRDKSYALSGILGANGASLSPPDYSRTLEETYRVLFRDVLHWRPDALTFILSAGKLNQPEWQHWPSWLPNWTTPDRNAWLVNRYRQVEQLAHAAPGQLFPPPVISSSSLTVKGRCGGTIDSSLHFSPITDKNNHDQLINALFKLTQWVRSVLTETKDIYAYNTPVSAAFAILEGRSPSRQAKMTYSLGPKTGTVGHRKRIWRVRESWEEPYNFTDLLSDFEAFRTLWTILQRPSDTTAEAFLTEMKSQHSAFEYFVRIVNRIAGEGRCLLTLSCGMAGSGPLETINGDEVFLIPGVRAPLLLRGHGDDEFIFIGPVLIHGLMHGEEFGMQSASRLHKLVLQ